MPQNPRRLLSKKIRVLVVSHDPEMRRNLTQGLHEAGHQVFDVDNRIDAMRLMYEMQPDLIFLQVAAGQNESVETFAGIRLVTDTPVILLADQSLSAAYSDLRKRNALVLVQPIVIAQAIAKAQVFFRSTRARARQQNGNGKGAALPGKHGGKLAPTVKTDEPEIPQASSTLRFLQPGDIMSIEQALKKVAPDGEIRLTVENGRLFSIQALTSVPLDRGYPPDFTGGDLG